MVERTLLVIKPDAVRRNLIGEIIRRIENHGFRICDIRMLRLTRDRAEAFYKEHYGKAFYEPLIEFMTSGPCVSAVLEGENAILGLRDIVGATDPASAAPGTIRKDFGENGRRNSVHASDSPKSAEREIAFFFGMPNITVSLEESLIKSSRAYTKKHQTSLNTLIRNLLERTVRPSSKHWMEDCFDLMDRAKADSKGRKWKRED